MGISWKKAKKLLSRANPEKRKEFLEQLKSKEATLLKDSNELLVYIDEAHMNCDISLSYGWQEKSERYYVSSAAPSGYNSRVSLYGVYFFNYGTVEVFDFPSANKENTAIVLNQIKKRYPSKDITVIWDNASYHKALDVREKASEHDIQLFSLPPYSPDFMPVEELWKWLKENTTKKHYYENRDLLLEDISKFVYEINQDPIKVADRLLRVDHLDPEIELLRI